MVKTTKIFEGRRYDLISGELTKPEANKMINRWHNEGYYARKVKTKSGYYRVWASKR